MSKSLTKWTETNVLTIRAPGNSADEKIKHPTIKGLAIRFRNGGAGVYTYYFTLNGVAKKIGIDAVGAVTLKHAEDEAQRYAAEMTGANPVSPVATRAKALEGLSVTLGACVTKYLADLANEDVTAEYRASRALYLTERLSSLHSHPIKQVDRATLRDLLKATATTYGKSAADNQRRALSAFWHWAISEDHAENDPVAHLPKMEKVKRTRVPQISALASLWRAAGKLAIAQNIHGNKVARRYGVILKLLLLTAARRNQIGQLRWDEVHLERDTVNNLPPHIMLEGKMTADEQRRVVKAGGTVTQSRSKNRTQFMIVLSRQAVKLLSDLMAEQTADGAELPTYVFGSCWNRTGGKETGFTTWGQGAELLKEAAGGQGDWIHHDFRRSFQTLGQDELEIPFNVVDIMINHVPTNKAGTGGSYNFATLKKEREQAAQKWADYIERTAREQAAPRLKIAA